jgi:CRP-like cAMP-binding protein
VVNIAHFLIRARSTSRAFFFCSRISERKADLSLILVDISQETLAEMIGTSRSRVSYFMNKFRKLGLISYNGKIEVHNSLLNAVLHDKPEMKRDSTSKS